MNTVNWSRLMIIGALAVVILSLAGIIAAVLLTGGVKSAPEVSALVAWVGTLVGLFAALVKLQSVSNTLNGHLTAHEDQVRQQTQHQAAVEQADVEQLLGRLVRTAVTDAMSRERASQLPAPPANGGSTNEQSAAGA